MIVPYRPWKFHNGGFPRVHPQDAWRHAAIISDCPSISVDDIVGSFFESPPIYHNCWSRVFPGFFSHLVRGYLLSASSFVFRKRLGMCSWHEKEAGSHGHLLPFPWRPRPCVVETDATGRVAIVSSGI